MQTEENIIGMLSILAQNVLINKGKIPSDLLHFFESAECGECFMCRLIAVFSEVRRVLRKDGVVWVNLGDSYGSGEIGRHDSVQGREIDGKRVTSKATVRQQNTTNTNMPPKSLLMIPARFAIAMQDAGWILRSECVWVKPNPMPESVTDRPTKSHEMVYLFAKSQRYWYDADAIREPHEQSTIERVKSGGRAYGHSEHQDDTGKVASGGWGKTADKHAQVRRLDPNGRNRRDVFTIPTEPTPFAHFATFPQALIEPLILAGCPVGGVVLDPFLGSGTTAIVARRLGRHYIGSELNAEYAALAETRLQHTSKDELAAALAGKPTTRPLWET